MRHLDKERTGLAASKTGSKDQVTTRSLAPSLPPTTSTGPADTLLPEFTGHDAANMVQGAFVVVVRTAGDRYRRRVVMSLATAERQVQRARDRGQDAQVLLARLEPVEVIA